MREASLEDHVLLSEMGARTFKDTFGQDNTPEDMAEYLAKSFSPEKQMEELAQPGSIFLIAEAEVPGGEEGIAVGYARLQLGEPELEVGGLKPIELVRIYSEKEWIGHGVGAALMQECLSTARDLGCDLVWLGVWQKNARAISFYQKWGFTIAGSQAFLLGRDLQQDYVMVRTLAVDEPV